MIIPFNDFVLVEKTQNAGAFQTVGKKNQGRITNVPSSMLAQGHEIRIGDVINFIADIELDGHTYVKIDDIISIERGE